jgi:hypothetical protein
MSNNPKAKTPKFPVGAIVVINGLVTAFISSTEATNEVLTASSAGLTITGHTEVEGEFHCTFKEVTVSFPENAVRRIR